MSSCSAEHAVLVESWETEQTTLGSVVETENRLELPVQLVGGADVTFDKDDQSFAVAALVVCSYPEMNVVHEEVMEIRSSLPYVPGFLAFREAPAVIQLLNRLKGGPHMPQLLLLDGNGILHPRKCGLATHVGVLFDLPTIGCAKKLFRIDGIDENFVRSNLGTHKGRFYIDGESGTRWGAAINAAEGSQRPVYVSIGNRISLDSAITYVSECSLYRVPEPIRQADILSRKWIRKCRTDSQSEAT
uniref:Endonuclease V n=1 Tax=Rhodosorus marinus TaxID=101924 RepID=A0A7S0G3K5_9RHOD|mmetsp:Transcript_22204/g.32130  ORF Transcript_22204/g.32130 Transcript_22204/m.32130 type:complete len:245 (+) Transcript_22204:477-1211(+)|eukprot:CAMPEP_0184739600 /NCGR_PEP_ID=MMETSP0315-20130426/2509_1 /TAXON_ID=101924 /ORGANISM="Rhodosorus marinus, Strain UTEX LB 2760" /LENGTH=244 /DNA_ID=CAMNT_0027208587 /DNA_START=458 /DNA_END=1192 /DNA_ORIENTATION=-